MKFSKYNLKIEKDDGAIILFNTLSGNCIAIDAGTAHCIENGETSGLADAQIQLLIQLGFVISSQVDEAAIVKYYREREKYATDAVSSTVLLTWACNLKCVYCFEGNHHKAVNMSIAQADKYIAFMKALAKEKRANKMNICLFGGEPLVNFTIGEYILKALYQYCTDENINFSCMVITNGTLMDADKIQKLISFNCNMIQVTLDGEKDIHDARRMYRNGRGSFDDIISTITLLNQNSAKVHAVIRINVDKTNLSETYSLLEHLGKRGLNLTNCTVDFGIVRGSTESCSAYSSNCFVEGEIGPILFDLWNAAEKEGFKYSIRPMRRFLYCGLYSDNQFTITPEGDVYKCWEHTGQPEHRVGTLNDNGGIVNIQYAFYDWMSTDPLNNADCRECVYLPNCGGGCGVVSYNETGTYHGTGCFKIKGVVEKQVLKFLERNNPTGGADS